MITVSYHSDNAPNTWCLAIETNVSVSCLHRVRGSLSSNPSCKFDTVTIVPGPRASRFSTSNEPIPQDSPLSRGCPIKTQGGIDTPISIKQTWYNHYSHYFRTSTVFKPIDTPSIIRLETVRSCCCGEQLLLFLCTLHTRQPFGPFCSIDADRGA